MNQPPIDRSTPLPELWGLSANQFADIIRPMHIAMGVAVIIMFVAVTIFARRWRLGFGILGAGMLIFAAPAVFFGLRTGGTVGEIAQAVLSLWWSARRFSELLLPLTLVALVARWLWDDLGEAFEVILDRWGVAGAVLFIGVVLVGYALHLLLGH